MFRVVCCCVYDLLEGLIYGGRHIVDSLPFLVCLSACNMACSVRYAHNLDVLNRDQFKLERDLVRPG